MASRTALSLNRVTSVLIANRPAGGVSMIERSRTLDIAIWRVRGIGVAVNVRTSTWVRSCFSLSLCLTPNHCSSSIITRPSLPECHVFLQQPVSADHDIDGSGRDIFENSFGFPGRLKS